MSLSLSGTCVNSYDINIAPKLRVLDPITNSGKYPFYPAQSIFFLGRSLAAIGDLIGGVVYSGIAVSTLGNCKKVNEAFSSKLYTASRVLPSLFRSVVSLNPWGGDIERVNTTFGNSVARKLGKDVAELAKNGKTLQARGLSLLALPALIISRVVDSVIASIAVALSVMTLGFWKSVNVIAENALEAPVLLIRDVMHVAIGLLNPSKLP